MDTTLIESEQPQQPSGYVRKPGRPNLDNYGGTRPLISQQRMFLKNYDSVNMISAVSVDAGSIAVGTQSGKILVFNKRGMELKEAYMAHTHKVTDIWIQHNRAIVSTSHDMTIKTKSLADEDFDKNIEIKGYKEELQCIAVIDNNCAPASLKCFVGTMEGRLLLYEARYFGADAEKLHDQPDEGPVTQVMYQFGIVVWSTPKKIRVIHYKRNRQKICMIPIPGVNPNLPQDIYVSNLSMPKIQMNLKLSDRSRVADPNVELYIAWFNTLKKVNLEYKDRIDKFEANTQFTKDVGNVFFVGHSTQMIKHHYVFCEFDHEPPQTEDGQPQPEQIVAHKIQSRVPNLVLCNRQWQKEFGERMDLFQGHYHDLHYNVAYDPASNDSFYLFNPDTLVRISVPPIEHKIEALCIRKRFDEALQILNHSYGRPMHAKVESAHFNHLLSTNQIDKAKQVIGAYLGSDREQWVHWLSRIMKRRKLANFIELIPVEQSDQRLPGAPRQATILPPSFYTRMYVHLIKQQEFASLETLLARTPEHITNADVLIQELKPCLERENHSGNPHLLESLYQLYQMTYNYENAFYAILKKKDPKVFEFLSTRQIDFPLNPNLGKLLRIDAKQAVNYILKRHGRHNAFKIVDTCVQELQKSGTNTTNKERQSMEQNVHLFLHEIFMIDKEMSRKYHEKQIELYIKFAPRDLMAFLQTTDSYPPFRAAELCQNEGLHREQAYLYFKTGKTEDAISVLIDNCCDNLQGVIELAVQFDVGNKQLWDAIIAKATEDNSRIAQLLDYVDVYEQPDRFIDAYEDDAEVGDMRDPLVSTFHRLEIYKGVLQSAVNATERSKQLENRQLMEISSVGFRDIHNKCDHCQKDLLGGSELDAYIKNVQRENEDFVDKELTKYKNSFFSKVKATLDDLTGTQMDELAAMRPAIKTDDWAQKELLKQSFVVFKCGHNFHKKCIVSQMGVEVENSRKERKIGGLVQTYSQIDKLHKRQKKSGLPLQSLAKKQKNYKCILCKKYTIKSTSAL